MLAGGLLTQLSSVQRMLGAPAKPADMAAIEAQEPIISGNPFAAMPDTGKVPAAVLPAAVEQEGFLLMRSPWWLIPVTDLPKTGCLLRTRTPRLNKRLQT